MIQKQHRWPKELWYRAAKKSYTNLEYLNVVKDTLRPLHCDNYRMQRNAANKPNPLVQPFIRLLGKYLSLCDVLGKQMQLYVDVSNAVVGLVTNSWRERERKNQKSSDFSAWVVLQHKPLHMRYTIEQWAEHHTCIQQQQTSSQNVFQTCEHRPIVSR